MKGCFDCGMDAGLAGREGEREGADNGAGLTGKRERV